MPLILCLWVFSLGNAKAQDTLKRKPPRRVTLLPVPTLGVAPETGFSGGAVVQASLRFYDDTLTRYSTAKAEGTYTARRQLITTLEWTVTTRRNRQIIFGDNQFLRFPELYWPPGPDVAKGLNSRYQANRLELFNEVDQHLGGSWYAGVSQRLQRIYKLRYTDNAFFDTVSVPGRQGGISSGLGISVLSDNRDRLLNPSAGRHYLAVRELWFGRWVGSDYRFTQLEVDARYYLGLGRGRLRNWLLAGQIYQELQTGQAPFRMLALLGSDSHMRGYYQGRYRDRNLHTAQLELRYPIWRWLRGTGFLCAGDVANRSFDLSLARVKTTAGLGIRILVDKQEQTYLRFDYAAGRETSGFYVAFGEAF